jgi:xanthosine utilization system XapX-like protein
MITHLFKSLYAAVSFVIRFIVALAAGIVVGLLYSAWAIATPSLKPVFAGLFNLAVGYAPEEPQEIPQPVAKARKAKKPRVYFEQWESEDGRWAYSIDYLRTTVDGKPIVNRKPIFPREGAAVSNRSVYDH